MHLQKGLCVTARRAKFRHSQEATTEKPGKLWVPDTIALWMQGKETSSGKGLQLVKPIQAPHKEPKSRQRPLEGQAGRDPSPSLIRYQSVPGVLWFHWSRQPFLSLYCLQNEAKGTSLGVQWLRFCLPMQGVWVWSLVRELRAYKPHSPKTKT